MFLEIVIGAFILWSIIQYLYFGNKPGGTPPGSLGLPFVGVVPPRNCTFEEHIDRCRKKYGETFWLTMGNRNVVFICEHDDIVTSFNNPSLQGRPQFFSAKIGKIGTASGIALGEGTQWKNLRRFAIRRLRDGGMGKSSLSSIILREADALVEDFEKHVGKVSELPWSINGSILNIIWKLVSDNRFEVDDEEINKLYCNISDFFNQTQGPIILSFDLLSWLENVTPIFMQNWLGRTSIEEKINSIRKLLRAAVAEHKATLDEQNPRDLIDSYLIELNKLTADPGKQSDLYNTFSENELVCLIFDLFIAGSETTSSTIRWYLLLMAKYPNIQKRVHEELDRVLTGDRAVSLDDKESLPFLEATIYETMRLKPIAPFGIFHVATEETTIDGYLIPKDTHLLPNIYACHRNPKFWAKPNEFYPEHFLNEDKSFIQKKEGFLTFSTGRRVCLGENLAKMDLFLVMATLMKKFSFTAPVGEHLSTEYSPEQPFFHIPKPFKLIINKR